MSERFGGKTIQPVVLANTAVSIAGADVPNDVLKVEQRYGLIPAILGANGTAACKSQVWFFTAGTYPTSGSFKVVFGGQTSGSIAYNATAAAVQTALEAMSSITAGKVSVSGGPVNTAPLQVEFLGSLSAQGPTLTPTFDLTNGGSGGLNAGVIVAAPLFKNGAGVCFGVSVLKTAAGTITFYDALFDGGLIFARPLKASIAEGDYLQGSASFSNALIAVGTAASEIAVGVR